MRERMRNVLFGLGTAFVFGTAGVVLGVVSSPAELLGEGCNGQVCNLFNTRCIEMSDFDCNDSGECVWHFCVIAPGG